MCPAEVATHAHSASSALTSVENTPALSIGTSSAMTSGTIVAVDASTPAAPLALRHLSSSSVDKASKDVAPGSPNPCASVAASCAELSPSPRSESSTTVRPCRRSRSACSCRSLVLPTPRSPRSSHTGAQPGVALRARSAQSSSVRPTNLKCRAEPPISPPDSGPTIPAAVSWWRHE